MYGHIAISLHTNWEWLINTSFRWRACLNSLKSMSPSLPATAANCCSNHASHLASLFMLQDHAVDKRITEQQEPKFRPSWNLPKLSHSSCLHCYHDSYGLESSSSLNHCPLGHLTRSLTMSVSWMHPVSLSVLAFHCPHCSSIGKTAPETA